MMRIIHSDDLAKIRDRSFALGFVVGSLMTTCIAIWTLRVLS